jgi:hypothetical protein
MFFVEPPECAEKVIGYENIVAYENMVDLAEDLYRGAMGDDGRVLRNVEVMAWSDSKRRIHIPHQYRVTADFVHEEDMDEEVDSEE